MPQLAACADCGESEHLQGFSAAAGGVVCNACEAAAFPLGEESYRFLVGALGQPLAQAPDASEFALAQVERAITETAEHHAHVRLRPLLGTARGRGSGGGRQVYVNRSKASAAPPLCCVKHLGDAYVASAAARGGLCCVLHGVIGGAGDCRRARNCRRHRKRSRTPATPLSQLVPPNIERCQNRETMSDQLISSETDHPSGPVAAAFAERVRVRETRELVAAGDAARTPPTASGPSRTAVSERRSSATATGSSTARRSGG